MKTAQELFDCFTQNIGLSKGYFISLIEVNPGNDQGQNWVLAAGNLPEDVRAHFHKLLVEMRRQYPLVDWAGVSAAHGARRRITGGPT